MVRPLSMDLRQRVAARIEAGETVRSIAAALMISPSCVSKLGKRKRETGSLAPSKIGGYRRPKLSDEHAVWLRQRIRSAPFTLRGLVDELAARGVDTSLRAVWVFVRRDGLSFKKNGAAG